MTNWGFDSNSNIKSAKAPKIKHDFKQNKPKKKERQKTIKTNASLVDKLGALQMALGYKNRTEAFEHVFRAGKIELLKGKPKTIARYEEAYKLLHN